jgi:FkbM family methyltransferase
MSLKMRLINRVQDYLGRRNFIIDRPALPDVHPLDLLAVMADRVTVPEPDFCVLQVGANDGQSVDPLGASLSRRQWRAVLVEPLPEPYSKLQAYHANHPHVTTVNCAVGDEDGQATIWRFEAGPDVPLKLTECASFNRTMLTRRIKNRPDLRKRIVGVEVPVFTVPSLMQQHGLPQIHLLQIDAEGYDYKIIHSALKAGIEPAIINFEHWHLTPEEKAQCAEELAQHGYDFSSIGRDTLAARQSILP